MLIVITTGEYSDYRILGIVETEKPLSAETVPSLIKEYRSIRGISDDLAWLGAIAKNEDNFLEWLVTYKEGFRKVAHDRLHV